MPMAKPVLASTTIVSVPPSTPLPHSTSSSAPAPMASATTRSLLALCAAMKPPTSMPSAPHSM